MLEWGGERPEVDTSLLAALTRLKEPAKSIFYLEHPELWVLYRLGDGRLFCPTRHKSFDAGSDADDIGIILQNVPEVLYVNLFEAMGMLDVSGIRRKTYGSFAELVADGWFVD